MRFTLRSSDSKWRYKKYGKRVACEMGASELITAVPIMYPIASDIEVVKQTEVQTIRLYGLCPDRFLLFTVCHFGG